MPRTIAPSRLVIILAPVNTRSSLDQLDVQSQIPPRRTGLSCTSVCHSSTFAIDSAERVARNLSGPNLTTGARVTSAGSTGRRQLAVVAFYVDDQCPEDLAAGIDHIRALQWLFDVTQSSVAGKKRRVAARV
jgi:hypothetical protein